MATSADIAQIIHDAKAAWKMVKPIKEEFDKITAPMDELEKRLNDALKGDIIVSDDENINKLLALGKVWNNQLAKWALKDENYWIEASGLNVLDRQSIPRAVAWLEQQSRQLEALEKIAPLAMMTVTSLNAIDMGQKEFWMGFLISTKALDIEARKQARQEFLDWPPRIATIKPRVENATKIVRRQMW